jgi:probable phosphoglycerate mutase
VSGSTAVQSAFLLVRVVWPVLSSWLPSRTAGHGRQHCDFIVACDRRVEVDVFAIDPHTTGRENLREPIAIARTRAIQHFAHGCAVDGIAASSRCLAGSSKEAEDRYGVSSAGIRQTVASGFVTSRVLLVRHGQSEWNAAGRWQGQADPPLSDLGRAQAASAARSLGALDAIYASDLQRAAETAAIISGALGVGPVILDPDLRERDAGEWSGLTREEIHERYPGHLPDDRHRAFAPDSNGDPRRPPGWEADDVLRTRVLRALVRIHDAVPDGDVLAVTHGGVIYVVEDHLGETFHRLANGAGRWVELDGDKLRLGDRVLLVNDDGTPVTVPNQL